MACCTVAMIVMKGTAQLKIMKSYYVNQVA